MPKISFAKHKSPVEVESGSNLMKALTNTNLPVASSCGGKGVCVKCRIKILEGRENLSKESSLEQDLRDIYDIPNDERISCQTTVLGDIKVDATYW